MVFGRPISFRCLNIFFVIGQFARLLPSVEVVAISQAPSPESNPNPPLPSTPWQSTTRPSLADRAVVRQKTPINRLSHGMNWVNTSEHCCRVRGIGFNFIHSLDPSLQSQQADIALMEDIRLVHVLAWLFAKLSNFAETATFLRQITSDVMSHAQIPAVQWFWGMHGLVLETSIWLLAESTRSQL
jgi:hypothetical protein